jgi:hypothetical protein
LSVSASALGGRLRCVGHGTSQAQAETECKPGRQKVRSGGVSRSRNSPKLNSFQRSLERSKTRQPIRIFL